MKPDAKNHNPDPKYIRALIRKTGLSQVRAGAQIGIPARTMRYYVSLDPESHRPAPYPVQYTLEQLAARSKA